MIKIQKIVKGALIAGGAAGIIIFLQKISNQDFGQWSPAITSFAAIVINMIKVQYSIKD